MSLFLLKGKRLLTSILKQILPPVIVKIVKNNLSEANCSGTYDSYQEAALACTGFGYEQEDLISVILEKTKRYKISLDTVKYLEPSIQDTRLALAISLAHNTTQHNTTQHNTTQHNTTQVIDFGGACGAHYFFANAFFKDKVKLEWHVVESLGLASVGKVLEDGQLHFYNNLESVKKRTEEVDLLFSSGTLQYIPDPYGTLKDMVMFGAKYIFLTRTAMTTEKSDLVTVQTSRLSENGVGLLPNGMKDAIAKYPVVFVRKDVVEEIVAEHYDIKMLWKEHAEAYRWNGHSVDVYGIVAERRK